MKTTQLLRLVGVILLPASIWAGPVQNPSDFSISEPDVLGSRLTIGGSYQFAGAISSLYWRGEEFVNIGPHTGTPLHSPDYGRQIQSSISVNNMLECFHPTEAGSAENIGGPISSSRLLSSSTASNVLQTSNQMAYWLHDGQWSPACQGGATAQGTLSNYTVDKTVRIGFAGIPNVIEYLTTFWVPEHIDHGAVEAVYAATTDFRNVWRYDLTRKQYNKLWLPGGEQDSPVVLSNGATTTPELYLGFYAPEALQPYDETAVVGWGVSNNLPPEENGGALRLYHRFGSNFNNDPSGTSDPEGFGPGHRHYRSYLVVGTKEEVQTALNDLHYEFRNLDPEVFNWKEYVAMYPDVKAGFPGPIRAQTHWLTYGISEGRNGSRTFSPATYLQLYPDLGSPTNYQFAIDHYLRWGRDEGRSTVKKAEAGFRHSTVLSTGLPKSAGLNNHGQLGNGTMANSAAPVPVSGLSSITEIANGDYTSLAVRADGTLWAWGSNQYGLLGNGIPVGSASQPVQVPIPLGVITPTPNNRRVISMGYTSAAALDEFGHVWTWGLNENGELGDGTTVPHYVPMMVKRSAAPGDYLTDIVSIAVGSHHMVALDADGQVWSWGSNYKGALGNGGSADSPYPVQVMTCGERPCEEQDPPTPRPLRSIGQITCGGSNFAMALTRDGKAYGWGNNEYGQLGLGDTAPILCPIAKYVESLTGFTKIAAGGYHTVALNKWIAGAVVAWGYNGFGQLGDNMSVQIQRNPNVMNAGPDQMDNIIDVAAGWHFSMMIRGIDGTIRDRAVYVVGDNTSGQLGTEDIAQRNVPVLSKF